MNCEAASKLNHRHFVMLYEMSCLPKARITGSPTSPSTTFMGMIPATLRYLKLLLLSLSCEAAKKLSHRHFVMLFEMEPTPNIYV